MRRYLIFLSLSAVVSLFPAPSFAQKKANLQEFSAAGKEETEEDVKAARRKAIGLQDLGDYGANKEPPPKPFPWMAVLLGVCIMGALTPLALRMYKSTHKELEDLSTFGRGKGDKGIASSEGEPAPAFGRRPPARALKAAKAKEAGGETRAIEGEDVPGGTPRDLVWDAVSGANGSWVTADWVSTNSGLAAKDATEELAALVSEGYLEEARDRAGKPVFRTAPA